MRSTRFHLKLVILLFGSKFKTSLWVKKVSPEVYMKIYDNFLIVGDFNSEMAESAVDNFCGTYHLHNLIKDPKCFKNPYKPSCID